jgi:hypothetical protein
MFEDERRHVAGILRSATPSRVVLDGDAVFMHPRDVADAVGKIRSLQVSFAQQDSQRGHVELANQRLWWSLCPPGSTALLRLKF